MSESGTDLGRREPAPLPMLSVGMVLFLGSEVMFFAALFASYFAYRGGPRPWPPHGAELDVVLTGVFTVVLVASSVTWQAAVVRIRKGDRSGMLRWVGITFVLGAVFLMGQAYDYAQRPFEMSSHTYGSTFYTMTGFHGLHVAAGLVLMLVVLGRAGAGAYSAGEHAGVEAVGYYWHFVDVVWIALFATIFLLR